MRRYSGTAALLACLAASGGAGAAEDAGRPGGRLTHLPASALLRMCQSPQRIQACDGYISGISDGITLAESAAGPEVARKVCIPAAPAPSGAQLRGAVVGWMSKHPDRLSGDVGPVAFDALAEAFPCAAGAAKP